MTSSSMRAGAREVVLIVLGILIAFAVDAGWDKRNRRITELDLLSSLRTEMVYNLQALNEEDILRASSLSAARALFALTGPGATAESYQDVETLLLQIAAGANTFEPQTGTINSILEAGALDLVRNDTLRSRIASWHEQLRDVREEEDRSIAYLLEHFWTYLEGRVVLHASGSGWEGSYGPTTATSLLRDPVFAKHVAQQMHRLRLTMDDAADLRTLVEEMLRLVDRELDWRES